MGGGHSREIGRQLSSSSSLSLSSSSLDDELISRSGQLQPTGVAMNMNMNNYDDVDVEGAAIGSGRPATLAGGATAAYGTAEGALAQSRFGSPSNLNLQSKVNLSCLAIRQCAICRHRCHRWQKYSKHSRGQSGKEVGLTEAFARANYCLRYRCHYNNSHVLSRCQQPDGAFVSAWQQWRKPSFPFKVPSKARPHRPASVAASLASGQARCFSITSSRASCSLRRATHPKKQRQRFVRPQTFSAAPTAEKGAKKRRKQGATLAALTAVNLIGVELRRRRSSSRAQQRVKQKQLQRRRRLLHLVALAIFTSQLVLANCAAAKIELNGGAYLGAVSRSSKIKIGGANCGGSICAIESSQRRQLESQLQQARHSSERTLGRAAGLNQNEVEVALAHNGNNNNDESGARLTGSQFGRRQAVAASRSSSVERRSVSLSGIHQTAEAAVEEAPAFGSGDDENSSGRSRSWHVSEPEHAGEIEIVDRGGQRRRQDTTSGAGAESSNCHKPAAALGVESELSQHLQLDSRRVAARSLTLALPAPSFPPSSQSSSPSSSLAPLIARNSNSSSAGAGGSGDIGAPSCQRPRALTSPSKLKLGFAANSSSSTSQQQHQRHGKRKRQSLREQQPRRTQLHPSLAGFQQQATKSTAPNRISDSQFAVTPSSSPSSLPPPPTAVGPARIVAATTNEELIQLLAEFYAHTVAAQDKVEQYLYLSRFSPFQPEEQGGVAAGQATRPEVSQNKSLQTTTLSPSVSHEVIRKQTTIRRKETLEEIKMKLNADEESLLKWLRQRQERFSSLKNATFELLTERPNRTINVCLDGPKILLLPNVSDILYCYTRDQWIDKLWSDLHLSPFHYPIIVLNMLIFLFGTTGNIFVCLSVYRNHQLRDVTNYFIVNLAFADFLVILICLPATVVWDLSLTWFFGTIPCKLIMFLQDVSISVSVLTLTAISIDRYYAICHPLRFKSNLSQATRIIALIWLVSLLIMVPDLIYLSAQESQDLSEAGLDTVLYSDCNYNWSEQASRIFQFVKTILLYLLPFMLMFCAHFKIMRALQVASAAGPISMSAPVSVTVASAAATAGARAQTSSSFTSTSTAHSATRALLMSARGRQQRGLHKQQSVQHSSSPSLLSPPIASNASTITNSTATLTATVCCCPTDTSITTTMMTTTTTPATTIAKTSVGFTGSDEDCKPSGTARNQQQQRFCQLHTTITTTAPGSYKSLLLQAQQEAGSPHLRQTLLHLNGNGANSNSNEQQHHQQQLMVTMHNKSKLASRQNVAKMLMAIVALFGLCYLPVHLINFLRQFIEDIPQTDVTSTISMLAHCICYLNSAINPIIYNYMNSVFRAEFKKFLSSCFSWRCRSKGSIRSYSERQQGQRQHRKRNQQQHGRPLHLHTSRASITNHSKNDSNNINDNTNKTNNNTSLVIITDCSEGTTNSGLSLTNKE